MELDRTQTEKCYSGCHKDTEEEDDRETLGKEISKGKCVQRASGSAGGRWRQQDKTEQVETSGLWPSSGSDTKV